MKKIFVTAFFCGLIAGDLTAQFVPNSSQSFQLAPAFNPAFTGLEGFKSVKVGYRSQWSSFPGAPRFINLVASARLFNPVDVSHNALRVGAPISEDDIPKGRRIIHGLGGTIVHTSNGAQGIIENLGAGLTYSLHYPLRPGMYLAGGLSFNYESIRVRWDRLDLMDPDPLEESGQGPFSKFNVRAGVLLYTPKFYLHTAYYKLYTKTNSAPLSDIGYHYKASAGLGFRAHVSAALELRPSVLALMDQFDNMDLEYSAKLYHNDRAWGGFSYRDNGFLAIILGFEFNSLVGVSYSYEISTGGLQGFNSGSNEFILGLKLANLRKLNPSIW